MPPRCIRYSAVCDVHVAPACVAYCIGERCIGAIHRLVCCINMSHRCVLHRCAFRVASVRIACCMFPRCVLHRCALQVASVRVACCLMHRRALRVASARVGVLHRCVLHVACCKRAAFPQRTVVQSIVWCLVCACCSGEGVARCDTLCIVFRTVRCTRCVFLAAGTPRCMRYAVC